MPWNGTPPFLGGDGTWIPVSEMPAPHYTQTGRRNKRPYLYDTRNKHGFPWSTPHRVEPCPERPLLVETLTTLINNGTYLIDSADVADAILDNTIQHKRTANHTKQRLKELTNSQ
jgi:hypothetical protein